MRRRSEPWRRSLAVVYSLEPQSLFHPRQDVAVLELTGKQKRHLRSLGHHLEPTVLLGAKGITAGVTRELDESLRVHELVKVRLGQGCELQRGEAAEALSGATDSAVAQLLGKTILLYRPSDKPKIQLP